MILILILLFVTIPVFELYLLVQATTEWGLFSTLIIVIFTGVLGAFLARVQGFSLMLQLQSQLKSGQMPTDAIVNGILVLVGGLLLLTPGFFTDALGFSFVIPFTRQPIAIILKTILGKRVTTRVNVGFSATTHPSPFERPEYRESSNRELRDVTPIEVKTKEPNS